MSGHECDSGYFDRSICPDPCGTMHSYCSDCGTRVDECAHDKPATAEWITPEQLWANLLAATPERRMEILRSALAANDVAARCFKMNHEGELERSRAALGWSA